MRQSFLWALLKHSYSDKHPISSLLLPFGHAKDSKMQVFREILIYISQKILNNANDLKGEAK